MSRVAFVDGENLVIRYQDMVAKGKTPRAEVSHIPNVFVSSQVKNSMFNGLSRITYYTSTGGDLEKATMVLDQIRGQIAESHRQMDLTRHLNARVFRKPVRERKSRHVDIHITLDALRAAYSHDDVTEVLLITGDGDFIPVVEEIMRRGKRVYVAALSGGLNPDLARAPDGFFNLDNWLLNRL